MASHGWLFRIMAAGHIPLFSPPELEISWDTESCHSGKKPWPMVPSMFKPVTSYWWEAVWGLPFRQSFPAVGNLRQDTREPTEKRCPNAKRSTVSIDLGFAAFSWTTTELEPFHQKIIHQDLTKCVMFNKNLQILQLQQCGASGTTSLRPISLPMLRGVAVMIWRNPKLTWNSWKYQENAWRWFSLQIWSNPTRNSQHDVFFSKIAGRHFFSPGSGHLGIWNHNLLHGIYWEATS